MTEGTVKDDKLFTVMALAYICACGYLIYRIHTTETPPSNVEILEALENGTARAHSEAMAQKASDN